MLELLLDPILKQDKSAPRGKLALGDLHIHTKGSDGLLEPFEVVELAQRAGLDAIAITDHEIIDPAKEAKEYCRKCDYPLEVIIGAEITTSGGHLIGLYLEKNIPSGKSTEWTIRQIHEQGGLVIAPHFLYATPRSLTSKTINSIINHPDKKVYFDGVEMFNASVYNSQIIRQSLWNRIRYLGDGRLKPFQCPKINQATNAFYHEHEKKLGALLGGSDAHLYNIGMGLTGWPENLSLCKAIKSGQTFILSTKHQEKVSFSDIVAVMGKGWLTEPIRRIGRYLER